MNTVALQQLMVQVSPKVENYFGDFLDSPLRIVVTINYLLGIINRFVLAGDSSPMAVPSPQESVKLSQDLHSALKEQKPTV